MMQRLFLVTLIVILVGALTASVGMAAGDSQMSRAAAAKQRDNGNWKVAYEAYAKLATDPENKGFAAGDDLRQAITCLEQLGRATEEDELREKAIAAHEGDWRFLQRAAESYALGNHWGYIIAGKFERGYNRGGDGKYVNAVARDRARALQLMEQGRKLIEAERKKGNEAKQEEAGRFYANYAEMLLTSYHGREAWRLQTLTDFAVLPDYEEGYGYYGYGGRGAPVDEKGEPVFHKVPKSWEEAKSDGERWRWCLMQASEMGLANEMRYYFASFLREQFDVQTMAYMGYGQWGGAVDGDDGKKNESGPYAVATLGEDETIAKLASGVKRFKLPDEYNFIKIFQTIIADKSDSYADSSYAMLCQIFEDRQQYPRAAGYWKEYIARFGPGYDNYRQKRLDQIVGNWGQFEPVPTQANDAPATLGFRFRNGKKVTLTATEIDVEKLLAEVKAYLKSNPRRIDSPNVNLWDITDRFAHANLGGNKALLTDNVTNWAVELTPREKHFDRRITIKAPVQKAGAYLVKATMDGGNVSYAILFVADLAIVKKPLNNGVYYYVGDAATGSPMAGAEVELFGYRSRYLKDNNYKVDTEEAAAETDADGGVVLDNAKMPHDYQWIVQARVKGKDGKAATRMAWLGFDSVWYGSYAYNYDYQYNNPKVFAITDRPVYRPGNAVKYKLWINYAKYDEEGKSAFAGKSFTLQIHDPKGAKVSETQVTADAFGGIAGEFTPGADAALGTYGLQLRDSPDGTYYGGGSFRLEEYKKPEFEVTVEAPEKPVMLGEKITATVKAKYYFGSPVTEGKVKYKVLRTNYAAHWYPRGAWDWYYGPGYWWFAYDYRWYPGWAEWGCARPAPWWWHGATSQPEVVSEAEVPVGNDGTIKIDIDTAVAKAMQGDVDHRYEISAEVTDNSRRTIVGTGQVLVARKPFKVYVWVDRGYYRTGDVINATFNAQTLDNKPVEASAITRLFKVTYDKDGKPVEKELASWKTEKKALAEEPLRLKAAEPGQYRLAVTATDEAKHAIEGGYVFVIRDDKFTGKDFRFNDLELVADKKEYRNGDKVRLMVNTNREKATVLFFTRPANSVYLKPTVMRMEGKSAVQEIEVSKKDMPNFFVEAVTISSGKVYEETREVVVPPEDRVLNVTVAPASGKDGKPQTEYKPGEKATFTVKVTEKNGEPFDGSTVLTVYDKSVEYISGGSNVGDIKAFYWKWRRSHDPRTESSLARTSWNHVEDNKPGMSYLGVFGQQNTEYPQGGEDLSLLKGEGGTHGGGGGGGFFVRAAGGPPTAMPAPALAPMGAAKASARPMGAPGGLAADAAAEPAEATLAQGMAMPAGVEPTVRKNFADTALWVANVETKNGVGTVELPMPENLTTWKARVWTLGAGTRVGQGDTEVVTRKNVIVRLQAPRFFTQKDEVVLTANVHNYLKASKSARVVLETEGGCLELMGGTAAQTVEVAADGEARVDWRVRVVREGEAKVRMKAITDEESDATEMSFPVYVHGMLKTDSFSGAIRPEGKVASVNFNVPKERRVEQSVVEVRYSPSVALAMVDALPYMVDYPYGCTEQTLNRFVPTVVTYKILSDMGLDLADLAKKRSNLNAQEIGDDAGRARQWKRFERNPVFAQEEVNKMVRAGIDKLSGQQLTDGGWGWFSGYGEQSWPHTTAVVVHGLQVAKANDAPVPAEMLARGVAWLKREQEGRAAWIQAHRAEGAKASNEDALVYMVLADAEVKNAEMRDLLYEDRNGLSVYGKAVFGMGLHQQKEQQKLAMILENISQFVVQDDENQTAYLKMPADNYWWCWYGSEFEAHAYYLKLLAKTDPKGETGGRMAKYLINNRKHATYWNSTRDTALCVEALADYIKAAGEDKPDMTLAIALDGKKIKEVKIDKSNLFTYDNKLVLNGAEVADGAHRLEFTKTGTGPVYFNAYVTNFTLEDHITKAGLEVKVERKVYKLIPVDKRVDAEGDRGQAFKQKVEKFERQLLGEGASLKSGDRIEVELEIDSKNDYEYILFEDMKAAGFEPVQFQSGYIPNDLNAFVEFRDNRVCFFTRALARGKHSVSYQLRAETPGVFAALPAKASAMYAPELRGNSDEIRLRVEDVAAFGKGGK